MQEQGKRQRELFDFDWVFRQGDPAGAQVADFDDSGWRRLNLPHDWSIEGPWAENNPSGFAGGYAPLGNGWYRKHFRLSEELRGKRIFAEFDGVFNRSDVWINGQKVGHNENGYISFACDLTPWVKFGQDNVLAVRADNQVQAARWYTGSGIYRHVWFTATAPLHVAHWGTYITTPEITDSQAQIKVQTTLRNDSDEARNCTVVTRIVAPDGKAAGEAATAVQVVARRLASITQVIRAVQPQRWNLESPRLYRAVSAVREGEQTVDTYETPFGIRTIEFNVQNGFLLNGERVVIKGVNLHGDWGALGAASFDRAQERRLEIIRAMGCNAVRLSHHPHASEMLDLCDRMGLLVFPELTDKWYGFQPDGTGWKEDLKAFIQRDRNHPSIFIWSTGNEIMPHQIMREGTLLYQAMQDFVHEFEPTRPVTAALHPQRQPTGEWSGDLPEMARDMDVITMNYSTPNYTRDHAAYPNQVFLAGEVHVHELYDLNVSRRPTDSSGQAWFATQDS